MELARRQQARTLIPSSDDNRQCDATGRVSTAPAGVPEPYLRAAAVVCGPVVRGRGRARVSAQLASRVFTITATAARAGLNPLAHLRAYLEECARAGGTAPTGEALTRFLPWAITPNDLAAWANDPRPSPKPDTTGSDPRPAGAPRTGPAP